MEPSQHHWTYIFSGAAHKTGQNTKNHPVSSSDIHPVWFFTFLVATWFPFFVLLSFTIIFWCSFQYKWWLKSHVIKKNQYLGHESTKCADFFINDKDVFIKHIYKRQASREAFLKITINFNKRKLTLVQIEKKEKFN